HAPPARGDHRRGVVTLALVAHGTLHESGTDFSVPLWVKLLSASATTLLSSSFFGYPLSTTHVVSGGILGSGIGKRLAEVRWGIAGQMVAAWVLTLSAAALVAAGGETGALLMTAVAAAAAGALFYATRRRGAIRAGDV